MLSHLRDDAIGQAKDDPLVDRPGLKPMPEGTGVRSNRGRVVVTPTLRAVALHPDIPRDRLPATAPRENEVHDRHFGGFPRPWHEGYVVFWTSLPGLHGYRAIGLRNHTAEGRMALPPLFCWVIRFLRAISSNSDSPHFGVFLRGSQDPLKLPVDRFPSFGRVSP